MGNFSSVRKSDYGGVTQGTLTGPELFMDMVSHLYIDIPDVKYMDDTSLIDIANGKDSQK